MMIPIPLAGAAITGSALLAKYVSTQRNQRSEGGFPPPRMPMPIQFPASFREFMEANPLRALVESNPLRALAESNPLRTFGDSNPLQSVISGLTSAVSQLTKGLMGEDYNRIVKGFLPEQAELIGPRHLANTGELGLADMDGDAQDELLASYRTSHGVGTLVLKKDGEQWYKLADLSIPGYSGIDFRDTANLAGQGKQQLLLGFPAENGATALHAYSLENGTFKKLFEQKCGRFDIFGGKKAENGGNDQSQLAFWNKDASGAYKIDVVRWNGLQLESAKNKEKYYLRKVIPLHAQMVKSNPHSPSGWLKFAGVLADAGFREDALEAVNMGLRVDRGETLKDRFLSLKSTLE